MNAPFFSIVIPVYNRGYILAETLESITAQDFQSWEVILVDDGSTDDTAEIARKLCEADSRIHYVFQENAERSAARNNGASQARGKYLLFLDSDDKYAEGHLRGLYEFLVEKDFPVSMVFTNLCYLTGEGLQKPNIPIMPDSKELEYLLLQPITPSRVCIHRDIFQIFRFDPQIVIVEDLVLWVCIVTQFPVFQFPSYSVYYRVHGGNSVDLSRNSYLSRYKGLLRLFNAPDYAAVSAKIPPEIKSHLLAECCFNMARHFEYVKKYGKMNRELFRSFCHKPGYRNKERIYMFLSHFPLTSSLLSKRSAAKQKSE